MTTINQNLQERIDALRALQGKLHQEATTALTEMIANKTGFRAGTFNFSVSSSSVEIREATRNWFNLTIYISKNWDSDSFSVSLGTSGTTYEIPKDNCGFRLLGLQGVIAMEMLNNDLEKGIVGIAFRAVKELLALNEISYEISSEIESTRKATEAAERNEFEASIAPLFTEGATFTANDINRTGRISDHFLVRFQEYYYRIEKITAKTVKGSGARYNTLQSMIKSQPSRPIDTLFFGPFFGGSVQTPKETINSKLFNGSIGFCSILPFNHPVVQGQKLAEAE